MKLIRSLRRIYALYPWSMAGIGATPAGSVRITSTPDIRVTASGDTRITA